MTTCGCCQVDKYYRRGRQLRRVATSGRKERVRLVTFLRRGPAPPPCTALLNSPCPAACRAVRCVRRALAACRRSRGRRRCRVDRSMNDRNASHAAGRRPLAVPRCSSRSYRIMYRVGDGRAACVCSRPRTADGRPGLAQYTYILCLLRYNIDTDAQDRRHLPRPFQSVGCNGTRKM